MNDLFFHEATVRGFHRKGQNIYLLADGVQSKTGLVSVSVEFSRVRSIQIDGKESNSVSMVFHDGEILSLKENRGSYLLIVEWNDVEHHESVTSAYTIECEELNSTISSACIFPD